MTHVREEDRTARHRVSACKKGRHDYSEAQNIGAGITRRVCKTCAAVTIDLTNADELVTPIIQPHRNIGSLRRK